MGLTREERQIKEAFIDGYLTGAYPMGDRAGTHQEALQAWREHNTTNRAAPDDRSTTVRSDDLRLVLVGGAPDQAALDAAAARLREHLPGGPGR